MHMNGLQLIYNLRSYYPLQFVSFFSSSPLLHSVILIECVALTLKMNLMHLEHNDILGNTIRGEMAKIISKAASI